MIHFIWLFVCFWRVEKKVIWFAHDLKWTNKKNIINDWLPVFSYFKSKLLNFLLIPCIIYSFLFTGILKWKLFEREILKVIHKNGLSSVILNKYFSLEICFSLLQFFSYFLFFFCLLNWNKLKVFGLESFPLFYFFIHEK